MTENQVQEQETESMEQILHSIRDIIADDGNALVGEKKKEPAPKPKEEPAEEVLELTDVVEDLQVAPQEEIAEQPTEIEQVEEIAADSTAQSVDVLADIDAALLEKTEENFQPIAQEPIAEEEIPVKQEITEVKMNSEPINSELLAEQSAQASSAALKDLMNHIPRTQVESPEFRSGATVESLVIETLKPMLSDWLNQNLPIIVKELVEKEIRKLVPRD